MILEVLDKAGSPAQYWIQAAVIGAAGYFACRRWKGSIVLFALIAAFFGFAVFDMYHDPFVGPAVWDEGGWTFFLHSVGSVLVMLVLPIVGFVAGRRQQGAAISSKGVV